MKELVHYMTWGVIAACGAASITHTCVLKKGILLRIYLNVYTMLYCEVQVFVTNSDKTSNHVPNKKHMLFCHSLQTPTPLTITIILSLNESCILSLNLCFNFDLFITLCSYRSKKKTRVKGSQTRTQAQAKSFPLRRPVLAHSLSLSLQI